MKYLPVATLCIGVACASAPLQSPEPDTAAGGVETLVANEQRHSPAGLDSQAPPVITQPMAGEPDAAALAASRLVPSSCDDSEKRAQRLAELRVRRMRAEVDRQYRIWHEYQPTCWEGYRRRGKRSRIAPSSGLSSAHGRLGGAHRAASAADSVALGAIGLGAGAGSAHASPSRAGAAAAARSASGTNTQVAGIDEADIVKSDGRHVYLAMNGALRIVEALRPRLLSVTKFPGEVRELFVLGNRAVIYASKDGSGVPRCTYGYDCQFAGDGSSTTIVVLDIQDRSLPRVLRTIGLSGSLMASRRVGDTVHTVVTDAETPAPPYSVWPRDLPRCGTREAVVRAKLARLKLENEEWIRATAQPRFPTITENGQSRRICDDLLRAPIADGGAFTSVVSFDVRRDDVPVTTAAVESRPGAVFASAGALYLAVAHDRREALGSSYPFHASLDEVSAVHEFRIGERPGETRYLGSGAVPGRVLNQFAMDEWHGYLRLATSRGRVPDPAAESVVSVLASDPSGALVRVGAIEKIAPGEDIRAVRFDGERGYVVTYKKTDPLFVLDLSQPAAPRILGELKIPGFSTYIQRIDRDHLLSLGFDADDHGSFGFFSGLMLQLFDVSVPSAPRLLHKRKIGTRGSSSEAATNHLAFNYFAEKRLLAIPASICDGGGNGSYGRELSFHGLLVYRVSPQHGFQQLGGIAHGSGGSCSRWWSNAGSLVKRSLFLDDFVYSIASDRLKVQRLGRFGVDVAEIALLP